VKEWRKVWALMVFVRPARRTATLIAFDDAEVNARPPAVVPDESDDPLHRGVLGVRGVVIQTEHLSPLIAECE
jgi:hypothetical protein